MECGAMPKERTLDCRIGTKEGRGIDGALTVRWTQDGKRDQDCSPLIHPVCITYDRMGIAELDHIAAFIALDRAGCNRLIKALRRARDAAYGQDE